METVLRAAAIYVALLILLRVSGRRTLAELTTFEFVVLLIISEATQNAMIGDDTSFTTAFLAILTLLFLNVLLSLAKRRSRTVVKLLEGIPTVVVANGVPLRGRMEWARVSEDEVMEAARRLQGLERMDQVKFAILEASGGISVIPMEKDCASRGGAQG